MASPEQEPESDYETVESQVKTEPVMPMTSDTISAIETLRHYFAGLFSINIDYFHHYEIY
jgi:hypothetical protein